jgi:cob(I)alamin adenosyltransferase
MSLYTRGGDAGDTQLGDGSRASKASARVEAYGALDEAASFIGNARQAVEDSAIDAPLGFAQQRLFNCTSALANPSATEPAITAADIAYLESAVDELEQLSGGWHGFLIASGGEAATRLHIARTVTRRAERRVVALAEQAEVDALLLVFVNRLSDLLFAAASAAAATSGVAEEHWQRDTPPPSA